jgi:hypothetical protein
MATILEISTRFLQDSSAVPSPHIPNTIPYVSLYYDVPTRPSYHRSSFTRRPRYNRTPTINRYEYEITNELSNELLGSIFDSSYSFFRRDNLPDTYASLSRFLYNDISNNINIPTPLQMFNATETYVFSNRTNDDDDDEPVSPNPTCPISLEPIQDGETVCCIKHCNHVFKQIELIKWFSRNSHCPVCRHNICT